MHPLVASLLRCPTFGPRSRPTGPRCTTSHPGSPTSRHRCPKFGPRLSLFDPMYQTWSPRCSILRSKCPTWRLRHTMSVKRVRGIPDAAILASKAAVLIVLGCTRLHFQRRNSRCRCRRSSARYGRGSRKPPKLLWDTAIMDSDWGSFEGITIPISFYGYVESQVVLKPRCLQTTVAKLPRQL